MCSPERLLFLLKYGIAYVKMEKEVDGKIESTDQKHIMRYQQMFAAMSIREKLRDGLTSGVVWHTQGSGKTADSRDELMAQFRNNQSQEGNSGDREITVVNIQRFKEDNEKVKLPEYATNLQRIFIIDEAHRGYRPEGSFLANLFEADKNAVKIALTGTPLLKAERAS